jgi:hypothetical protein
MYLLQDDVVKFVSEPASPPRLVNIPEEGKEKAKERREVGEGDDTIIIEDTSDEEDEETLQERFQLRSRFSRPGLPNEGKKEADEGNDDFQEPDNLVVWYCAYFCIAWLGPKLF